MEYKRRKLFAAILVSAVFITVVLSRFNFLGAPIPNVSAVTAEQNIGVYWETDCSRPVSHVDWGMLSPGQLRDVVVYVRNEGNETFVLAVTPVNWSPENASRYLGFSWNCEDTKIEVGQVADVSLSLSVSTSITGIYDFGFEIVLEGREFFLGDLNRDGSVNIFDMMIVKVAFGSTPTDSNWNPKADVDDNGVVDFYDAFFVRNDLGKSW